MDIYFQEGYGALYETLEGGKAELYRLKSPYGEIQHSFIRRPIPISLNDGKQYWDLITPYGYGGPLILTEIEKDELLQDFTEQFAAYCRRENIVSEFVRFHPIQKNAEQFMDLYHPVCIRKTLGTNLKDYEDPVQMEFSKSCRKNIRQALRKGITYLITEAPSDISGFTKIYYETMKRNHASNFYYFQNEYFAELVEKFQKNILYVQAIYQDTTIAAGLYFISNGIIHTHLSGTLSEYLSLSPAYLLRYAATLWGKDHGYHLIHHGGGTSDAPDDSLFCFKRQFAQHTQFNFYVGKKIWNEEIYRQLCYKTEKSSYGSFFPEYRMPHT